MRDHVAGGDLAARPPRAAAQWAGAHRRLLAGLLAVVLAAAGATLIALALPGRQPPQPPLAQGAPPTTAAPTTAVPTGRSVGLPPAGVTTGSGRIGPGHTGSVRTSPEHTSPEHSVPPPARLAGTTPIGSPVLGSAGAAPVGPVMPRSVPVSIRIPAIGVDSSLLQLGLNADGSVQVPPLDAVPSRAGWYRYSPTPGQVGPAVILGHVDSAAHGPAIFYRLGALRPGDRVVIRRADGSTAIFRVDRAVRYPKTNFPTDEVYGNIDHAGLRLITCGGSFDFSSRQYRDDIVVYASLASSVPG